MGPVDRNGRKGGLGVKQLLKGTPDEEASWVLLIATEERVDFGVETIFKGNTR